jgi:hypothetical protein
LRARGSAFSGAKRIGARPSLAAWHIGGEPDKASKARRIGLDRRIRRTNGYLDPTKEKIRGGEYFLFAAQSDAALWAIEAPPANLRPLGA